MKEVTGHTLSYCLSVWSESHTSSVTGWAVGPPMSASMLSHKVRICTDECVYLVVEATVQQGAAVCVCKSV